LKNRNIWEFGMVMHLVSQDPISQKIRHFKIKDGGIKRILKFTQRSRTVIGKECKS